MTDTRATSQTLVPGVTLAGKYRIEQLLGEGGMGAVFLAENTDIGRKVAIKVLHADFASNASLIQRFRQEARAAAAIGHPGIVDVLDMGTTEDGSAFIVMERLDGESLGGRLKRVGRLGVQEAAKIVADVLEALAAAHDKGIIHRDLKPDNVFLVQRPVQVTKLLDFGISKLQGAEDVALTRTGTVMGTPLYMSPEQARGAKDIGPPTDLYSVGAMLYHALTGGPPFNGESYNEVLAQVLMETPRPLLQVRKGLPPSLSALVDSMLAKEADARPRARAAAAALRKAADEHVPEPAGFDSTMAVGPEATAPGQAPSPAAGVPAQQVQAMADTGHASVGLSVAPAASALGASGVLADSTPGQGSFSSPAGTMASSAPAGAAGAARAAGAAGGGGRKWAILGGLGVVAVGGVALFAMGGGKGGTESANPAGAAGDASAVASPPGADARVGEPPATPARVSVTLVAEPAQARWTLDDVDLGGCNPCSVERSRGSSHVAIARAPGFVDARVELSFDQAGERRVQLIAAATPAPDAGAVVKRPSGGDGVKKPPPVDAGVKKPPPGDNGQLGIDKNNPFKPK